MTQTRENVYIMLAVTRRPRQIVGLEVTAARTARQVQGMIDSSPAARTYYSDGFTMYRDVSYWGKHIVAPGKSQTYTVEGINADLRHYISGLARRKRCFFRSIETLTAVLRVFVNAYNQFGLKKAMFQRLSIHKPSSTSRLHKYADVPFALIDFL
jgi:IS1 family transposase